MKNDAKLSTTTTHTATVQSGTEHPRPEEEDEIRARAYELFLARNCEPGHADDDWFRAASEIKRSGNAVSPGPESSR